MMVNKLIAGMGRYSTMLAENLLGTSNSSASVQPCIQEKTFDTQQRETNADAAGGFMELIAGKWHLFSVKPFKKLPSKHIAYIFQKQSDAFSAETKSNTETKTHAVEADDDYSIQSEDELVRPPPKTEKKGQKN